MKLLLFSFLIFANVHVAKAQVTFNDSNLKEKQVLQAVVSLVKTKHVAPKKIDDDFSKKMFKTYIDSLDTNKIFFLQSDIDEFKQYETKLDDQIKNNDLSFLYLTRKRYLQRVGETYTIFGNLVANGFEFYSNDYFVDPSERSFSKDQKELIKQIRIYFKREAFYFGFRNGYDSSMTQKEFDDYILDYSKNILPKKIENTYNNVNNLTNDILFYFYINSFISQLDDHSIYYLPIMHHRYKLSKSNNIYGYGFTSRFKDNFLIVEEIVSGGPAFNLQNFEAGDAILKVGFDNEEQANVIGYTLIDFFKLLNSKSKSEVIKLTIKKPNGTIKEVQIKRGTVATKDSYIKSAVVAKNNKKYAILKFSKFYNELYEGNMRNAAADFSKELKTLNENNVAGLVLDIRDNSGDTLETALKIISNFVKQQNIGIVKDNSNKAMNLATENETINWDKNIVLLVNEDNQSSAEFIANAFKDLQIGIVIGNTTYGNATVKQILDLNAPETTKNLTSDVGALILTTQKFYNTAGKSIQKSGVVPDIKYASKNKLVRENSLVNALNNDGVAASSKQVVIDNNRFAGIIKKSQARLASNKIYQYIINDKLQSDIDNITTLNSKEYKKQYDAFLKAAGTDPLENYNNNLVFTPSSESEEKALKKKVLIYEKRKEWLQSLSQDFQIEEGINILEEMNSLNK